MSDTVTKKQQDSIINLKEPHEMEYWSKTLNISKTELQKFCNDPAYKDRMQALAGVNQSTTQHIDVFKRLKDK